ncbi:MAG: sulfatase [Prosthecobacter sp.]|nr:sulfatase [Prosthecobacter sp.]
MRRLFILGAALLLIHSGFAEERLNVLFIAIDDLGNVLSANGDPAAKTPHLDRLTQRGVRFDHAYCQIPLCNPSRASVLTGLRPDAVRVYDLDRHFREQKPEVVTLPQLFKNHGWFSARVGKIYHYDVPRGIGTDGLDDAPSWDLVINPKGRDVADEALITNPTPQKPVSAALCWLAADGTDEEQTDGMIATEAIKLLEQPRERPFFLGVGFFRPHTPYVAPKHYFDLHPLESIHLPTAPANDRDDIPPAAFAHNNPTPNYGLDELTCRRALQAYHASVSFVDAQIGRVLDALDRLHLTDKTIIVLWSDHGYHLGEHLGMWQKRCLFEESARAPLMICMPGAKGNGQASARVVEFVDIYPTLADLCGLPKPESLTGHSLRALLEDPAHEWEAAAVTQILRPGDGKPIMGRSIRTEDWRYTEWNEGQAGVELYDHRNDPHEFTNLANTPQGKAIIPELQKALKAKAEGTPPSTPFNPARL